MPLQDLKRKEEEQKLIERLRQGDEQGLKVLYDRYGGAIYGVIFKVVRQEVVAEDVLQESFVKFWKSIDKYDPQKGSLFTWMLNIARNSAIDKTRSKGYKKQGKVSTLEGSLFNNNHLTTTTPTDHIGIREKLYNLKPELRIILELIYFQGYTQTQVADELMIPLGTVKTRVRIALREMKQLVDDSR